MHALRAVYETHEFVAARRRGGRGEQQRRVLGRQAGERGEARRLRGAWRRGEVGIGARHAAQRGVARGGREARAQAARPQEAPAGAQVIEQEGTYALPEAQLDRFLLKVKIDYPSDAEEAALVRKVTAGMVGDRLDVSQVQALVKPATVVQLQSVVASIRVDDQVLGYALRLARATRQWAGVSAGAGPRGGIALVRVARAVAALSGRDFVTPDDVKRMALPALRHRVLPAPELELEGRDADAVLKDILDKTQAPRQ